MPETNAANESRIAQTYDAPLQAVWDAWTRPERFRRWWLPRSMGLTLVSIEMDVRPGGTYRLLIGDGTSEPMPFFGTYLEVVPLARLVWTNDEGDEEGSVTTVTFEEQDGRTLLVLRETYPSSEALRAAEGMVEATTTVLTQLAELLVDEGPPVP
jgi:uncharacterized protein YndB with AHSA1/START domain